MIQKSRIIIETEKPSFEFLINYSLAHTGALFEYTLNVFQLSGYIT
jgi:hypothetical protein